MSSGLKILYIYIITVGLGLLLPTFMQAQSQIDSSKTFRAGAAKSVITPPIGTSINGGMQDRTVQNIHDETNARSIVLDDGDTRLAIVVSDLCMIYRKTLDKAKARANELTGIPVENMLMSATHTHSAGTACSVFQSDPSPEYLDFLSMRIADAVVRANENLVPAKIGWGVGQEASQVFNRRWKMEPGTKIINPFGEEDEVSTNPGVGNPNLLEPAGPIDPEVPVVSIQSTGGDNIALLANYSLHYVGGTGAGEISADYYGMFADKIAKMLERERQDRPFIAIMSNGTSGNINNVDFTGKQHRVSGLYGQMQYVANILAAETYKVVQNIEYRDWIALRSVQKEIELGVRLPGEKDIERANRIVDNTEGSTMKTKEEIYARETLLLDDYPETVPVILQAFQIGNLSIAAIPCEVFVETGLKLKDKSPFETHFTISLANGYNGYLPTPEQHDLGGYETWRARSSYLETDASEKITSEILKLLRQLKER